MKVKKFIVLIQFLLGLVIYLPHILYGQFEVKSVHPPQNSITAAVFEEIRVTFSDPVDMTGIADKVVVWGEQTGVYQEEFQFGSNNSVLTFKPLKPYKDGEKIFVVLTDNISSNAGQDLTSPFQWSFKIRVSRGVSDFERRTSFDLWGGKEPVDVIAADVNGDGYPETITANNASNSVTILTNEFYFWGGSYYNGEMVPVGPGPTSVAAGDLNGDGFIDLVTTNFFSNTLSILTNDGSGNFTEGSIVVEERPIDLAVEDFNNDGHRDLALLSFGSDELIILINQGGGLFPNALTFPTGEGPISISCDDFDKDGDMDVFLACRGEESLKVFKNNGSGIFTINEVIPLNFAPSFIETSNLFDVSNGNVDILTLSRNTNSLAILEIESVTKSYQIDSVITTGSMPMSAVCTDFDASLRPGLDVIVTNFLSEEIRFYENYGFQLEEPYSFTHTTGSTPTSICQVDVDRDGDMDLMVTNLNEHTATWFRNNTPGEGFDPDTLNFGEVCIDREKTIIYPYINQFSIIVTIDSVHCSNPVFTTPPFYGNTVFPGESLKIPVTFSPTETIWYNGALIIDTDNPHQDSLTVPMKGRGVLVEITAEPDTLEFDSVPPGEQHHLPLKISNGGNTDCYFRLENSNSTIFHYQYDSYTLGPHSDIEFLVTFEPAQEMNYTDSLLIISSGSACGFDTTVVILNGTGSWNGPTITSDLKFYVTEDNDTSYVATAEDPDSPILTFGFFQYPSWMSTAGMPQNEIGAYPREGHRDNHFFVRVSDGFLADTQRVAVIVRPVNDLPILAMLDPVSGDTVSLPEYPNTIPASENEALSFVILAYDDEDSLMDLTNIIRPGDSEFYITGRNRGLFSWTPNFTEAGTYPVVFKAVEVYELLPMSVLDTLWISVGETLPDLYIDNSPVPGSSEFHLGQSVTFYAEMGNRNAPVTDSFRAAFYRDGEEIFPDTLFPTGLDTGLTQSFRVPIQFPELGTHTITVKVDSDDEIAELNENNNEQSLTVSVTRGRMIIRPNPFTPNGDGYNDYVGFDLSQLALDQPKLQIFTFSGSLIRTFDESQGERFEWHGNDSGGRQCLPGVYLYILFEGGEKLETGSIVLAR